MRRTFLLIFILFVGLFPVSDRLGGIDYLPVRLLATEPTVSPVSGDQLVDVQQRLDKILTKYRFNGSIMVMYKGYPLYRNAVGLADFTKGDSLAPNSPFQLASVSKSFTALAVMILHDRNKLSFDDTVVRYIPEFPYKNVTIRQLLNHTSGLPNYLYLVEKYWKKDEPISNREMIDLLAKYKLPVYFKAGSRFDYSNTGYAVLAYLVEEVSGVPFHTFMQNQVFQPLGMHNTFTYEQSILDTLSTRVKGHVHSGRKMREYPYDPADQVLGDKSIFSTVEDLALYQKAWETNILVSDTTREQAFCKAVIAGNREVNYGFGWRFKDIAGRKVVFHNGLWHGFTATITRFVDDEFTVIILNNMNAKVGQIVNDIARNLNGVLLSYVDEPTPPPPTKKRRVRHRR